MRYFKLTTLLIVVVAGCSSFNRYELGPSYPSNPQQLPPDDHHATSSTPEQAKQALDNIPVCPEAHFTSLPPLPQPPLAALKKIKPGDQDAIDDVEMNYIQQLRNWGEAARKHADEEHRKYIEGCIDYQQAVSGLPK